MSYIFPSVEDYARKRELIARYVRMWNAELESTKLSPGERKAIEADIEMLRGIDEDLVRQRQSRSQSEQSGSERIANEALREEIALYIVQASDIVPAAELCAAFDISDQHLRNQMRALRKAGRVVIVRGGYAVGRTVAKSSSITSSTRLS
jgi:hypothetical protein